MGAITVGTFNCENLFARFKFNRDVDPAEAVRDGWDANRTHFTILSEDEKRLTAKAIDATGADVLALQEVENLDTLRHFRANYLGGSRRWPYALAIDGNDPRLIDVAMLSRFPIVHVRSWTHLRSGRSPLFSRDCLEVDIDTGARSPLTLFVNHFKSMLDKADPCRGRAKTRGKRRLQAETVREIVGERFVNGAAERPFVILGDLNDYAERDSQGSTGLGPLLGWDAVENVLDRLQPTERWTHFFKGKPSCRIDPAYRQLDYLLASRALADATRAIPKVVRDGLPTRATRYDGPRFPGVGRDKPKASDHCPVVIQLTM